MVTSISTKIFATLGNNSSLVPLGIKDIGNTLGMTAGSYMTGSNVESKDRFIDEFGTQVIWILGIPFFKEVIDKTIYKAAKFDSKIDLRVLQNKEIFKKAKEHATPELKEKFERVLKKEKLFKGLAMTKFAAATALTLASYSALTIFRHKHTEKNIMEELEQEIKDKQKIAKENKNAKNPAFAMNMAPLKQFMFDPVKNTMIIDGGITAQRLADSRNPQDFMGYIVKEGGFWVSMYFLGPWVQKVIEKAAAKNNKPIDLDIKILQDKEFKNAIKNGTLKGELAKFDVNKSDVEIYDSLFKQEDNLVVKMAKKAGIIKTFKGSEKIDTRKFIDIEQIKGTAKKAGLKEKLLNFEKAAHLPENKGADAFFKMAEKSKKWSIVKNMGASIGALGVIVPGIIVAMRYFSKDNKEFAVKKEMKEKLMQNLDFKGLAKE